MAEPIEIVRLGHDGDGVAATERGPLFVPYTLPGERVEVAAEGEQRARATAIVRPSPQRVSPICRHFGVCGGCALQHMARDPYLAWKRDQVIATFAQRGLSAPVEPIVSVQPGSRRRAIFSAVRTQTAAVFGFNRRRTETVFD